MPTARLTTIIRISFFECETTAPMCSPILDIAISAPMENSPMPIIRRHAPTMKASITLLGTGTTIKHNRNITAVTGSTDLSDSLSFSGRMVLNMFFTGERNTSLLKFSQVAKKKSIIAYLIIVAYMYPWHKPKTQKFTLYFSFDGEFDGLLTL